MSGDIDYARLRPGYIFARRYFEIWDHLSTKINNPGTDYVHYSILADCIDGHWFSVEQKDVTTLFPIEFYAGETVRIYSVRDGDAPGACRIALELTVKQIPYERFHGWAYFLRALPSLCRYWLTHGIKPIPWDKIQNVDITARLNCLSLLRVCYPDLIPREIAASPAAMEQAYRAGKLVLEQEGIIR